MSHGLRTGVTRRRKNNVNAALRASGLAQETDPSRGQYDISRFDLIPVQELAKSRRKPGEPKVPGHLRFGAVLRVPGQVYGQRPNLPPSSEPGVGALQKFFSTSSNGLSSEMRELLAAGDLTDDNCSFGFELPDLGPSRHHRRRVAQHNNWKDSVLSERVYRSYLAQKYGEQEDQLQLPDCACASRRSISITLVDWLGVKASEIDTCPCTSVVERLLLQGYFPCAPKSPSMAFSVILLDFISIHSLNVAPNTTAWSDTLETFWARHGPFKKSTGNFRKRLGMALTWYQVLDNRSEEAVSTAVHAPATSKRTQSDSREDGAPRKRPRTDAVAPAGDTVAPAGDPVEADPSRVNIQSSPDPAATRSDAQGAASNSNTGDHPEPPRDRPSKRLRGLCAACFGGERPTLQRTSAHVIVCLDANFAQKRRKSSQPDAHMDFLGSRFVPQADVDEMEHDLAEARKRPAKRRTAGTARLDDEVLDECEQSFIAAQEKVTKASKNYYADTGLMALLCRHDRVLWIANMTTPGERQHYALVLIRMLAKELPTSWSIGLLYDIACQLSRSIEKWRLLPDISNRITFAVSVFHAYGHQWPCQVIFHPRKRDGFGLSDGEGCERFWSAIRHLIAGLRVSGSRRRLFILDRQMQALDYIHTWKIGGWLCKRMLAAQRRLQDAEALIIGSGETELELGKQWEAQITAQVTKLPRQSQNAADKMIEKILLALGTIDDLKQGIKDDRKELRTVRNLSAGDTHKITTRIEAAQAEIADTHSSIEKLHEALGTENVRKLESLRGNPYLRARVNARALREKIRQSLVAHKFEHRKLERAYRHQVLQAKEHSQTKDLIHRRERTISGQVRKYNEYVDQMALLVRQGQKPPGRFRLPRKLDIKKLFRLDVDDQIWQEDPGLGPQGENDLPRYLCDGNVQRGISALLEKRRCLEEIERLEAEVDALRTWWCEEEAALRRVHEDASEHATTRKAVARRLEIHASQHDVWKRDLARSGELSTRFARKPSSSTAVSSPQPSTMTVVETADTIIASATEVDSDDASDAYSDREDEDDPLADWLDELYESAESLAGDHVTSINDKLEGGEPLGVDGSVAAGASIDGAPASGPSAVLRHTENTSQHSLSRSQDSTRKSTTKAKPSERVVYRAGYYTCTDDDLSRLSRRTAWLSGDGLATFLEYERMRGNISDVSIVHSEALWDVSNYLARLKDGDTQGVTSNKNEIVKKLRKLVHARASRKWLILGHVVDPGHWTLIEVRWEDRTIRYYDSYARNSGYGNVLKERTELLLRLYEECCVPGLDVGTFQWIWEQREIRQFNTYDCGPFAAGDAASLLTSNLPSSMTEADMGDWRKVMADAVRGLRSVEPVTTSSTDSGECLVIELD